MVALLVVLVAACALGVAVPIGRNFWARARSVERHQQALETLADLTQSPDSTSEARQLSVDHQAHVRVIGPAGPVPGEQAPLPPPRAFARSTQTSPSPLRRPSRNAPSAAAIDAVTASATLGLSSEAKLVRTRRPDPGAAPVPVIGAPVIGAPVIGAPVSEDPTLPALTPPPPEPGEPPTRPVPVLRPHVFYFDDTSGRTVAGPGPGLTPTAAPAQWTEPPPDPATTGPLTGFPPPSRVMAGGGAAKGSKRPVGLRLLAAAAILVVIAGAATTLALMQAPSHRGPAAQAVGPSPATSVRANRARPKHHPGSARPAGPTTTATLPITTTTPPPPPKAAVLVSDGAGTATYELRSPSASIVVTASGPCWIEVKAHSASGQVIYEGTLGKGQESSVTGPAWIRLGDPPYVALTVNGTSMHVPGATSAVPLNLQFTLG